MQEFSVSMPSTTYRRAAKLAKVDKIQDTKGIHKSAKKLRGEVDAVLNYAIRRGLAALESIQTQPTAEYEYTFNLTAFAHDGDSIEDLDITLTEFKELRSHLAQLRGIQAKKAA